MYNALEQIACDQYGPDFELKEWQKEATAHLLSGDDVLLTAPTGSGKSLPFHLYALARPEESVIVVSPLNMLEKDMVSKGWKT
jgi:superfamily II DNA helicase RecQ